MQEKFNELNELLKKFAAQKADHRTKVKHIQDSNQFTPQYKRQLLQPIEKEYIPLVDETRERIEQLMQEINEGIKEQANNADFLSSTELTNALKLIELSNGKLPINVVDKINNQFAGNVNALETLKSVYQAQNCYEGEINQFIASKEQEVQQIQDQAYYTLSLEKPLYSVATAIATYASKNGYDFDTSFLPDEEIYNLD